MFIKINEFFYNINTIKRYHLRDGNLYLYFIDNSDMVIYNITSETKELFKKLEYDNK